MQNVNDIINQEKIFEVLEKNRESSEAKVLKILEKTKLRKGLNLDAAQKAAIRAVINAEIGNIQRREQNQPFSVNFIFNFAGGFKYFFN